MNAGKALERKKLQKGAKLTAGLFHPRHRDKEWSEKNWYVTDIIHQYPGTTEVQISETDPAGHAAYRYDMVLTTKMKKKYTDRVDYLPYFKIVE